MYAMTMSRPDLAYAVGALSRYSAAPSEAHLKQLQQVVRYACATAALSLRIDCSQWTIAAYSDPSWGGDQATGRSTTGYALVMHLGGAISWASRMQRETVSSTMEAEYVAMAAATREVRAINNTLQELGHACAPHALRGDNATAILLGNRQSATKR